MKSRTRSNLSTHPASAHPTTSTPTSTHTFRRLLCLCLAFVLLVSIAMLGSIGSKTTALAADSDWVSAKISGAMSAKYGKYHPVDGLPADFLNYAQTQDNQFYYSIIDNHAIYCTEINQHSWYQNPEESTTSTQFVTDEEKALLTYLLAHGQRFFGEDEESVKRYTATQIAIWVLANKLQDDETMLNLILFPATGDFADAEAFAPTLEVGRVARALLNDAKAFVAGNEDPSKLLGAFIPSFMSTSEAAAQTFTLTNQLSFFGVDLIDDNGVLYRDWEKTIKVDDAGGFGLLFDKDKTLSVRSATAPTETKTLKFSGPYGGYELRFLSTDKKTSDGEPFQKMTRLARIGDILLYFKVTADAPQQQTGSIDLTKTVAGTGDPNKQFSFRATFKTASGTDVNSVLLNGKGFASGTTVPLKHGATAHFTNIPLGTTYELVEMDYAAEGYTSDKPSNTVAGAVGATDLITITYTNTYNKPGEPGNPDKPGNPNTPDKPNTPNTPNTSTPKTPGTTYPKTGDGTTFNRVALALALLAVLTPVGILSWKRYRAKQ